MWDQIASGAFPLIGVLVGGIIQYLTNSNLAKIQRAAEVADAGAERDRVSAKFEAERKFARATLARHLEMFARACSHIAATNSDEDGSTALLPEFPPWPNISWELLGAAEMAAIRDVEVHVDMQRTRVDGDIRYHAHQEDDARGFYMDGAARIGWTAWCLAVQLRKDAGIEPFSVLTGGWNFPEFLEEHIQKVGC